MKLRGKLIGLVVACWFSNSSSTQTTPLSCHGSLIWLLFSLWNSRKSIFLAKSAEPIAERRTSRCSQCGFNSHITIVLPYRDGLHAPVQRNACGWRNMKWCMCGGVSTMVSFLLLFVIIMTRYNACAVYPYAHRFPLQVEAQHLPSIIIIIQLSSDIRTVFQWSIRGAEHRNDMHICFGIETTHSPVNRLEFLS